MVALTARMQHECNYTDEQFAQRQTSKRLVIHPKERWEFGLGSSILRPGPGNHRHWELGARLDGVYHVL